MILAKLLNELQEKLPSLIALEGKITQAGNYLSLTRFSGLNAYEFVLDFKIYVAANSLNKDSHSALNLVDFYMRSVKDIPANSFLCASASYMQVGEARLMQNESLYIYSIDCSVRLRL